MKLSIEYASYQIPDETTWYNEKKMTLIRYDVLGEISLTLSPITACVVLSKRIRKIRSQADSEWCKHNGGMVISVKKIIPISLGSNRTAYPAY
jgi:hypothetical protein